MPKNKIEDLRNLLFETMERLMDPDDSMDVKTALAVGDVAQVIVNSAKVEADFAKVTGRGSSEFIQGLPPVIKRVPQAATPLQTGTSPETRRPLTLTTESHEDLCLRCELPECVETSPWCLVQIERKKLAA